MALARDTGPHQEYRRMKIGEILLQLGRVHPDQVEEALAFQRALAESGKRQSIPRIGQILLDRGFVVEEDILEVLGLQSGIPVRFHIGSEAEPALLQKVPLPFIRTYRIAPIKMDGDTCLVAMCDPLNTAPLDDVRLLLECPVSPVLCSSNDVQSLIDSYFDQYEGQASEFAEEIAAGEEGEISFDLKDVDRDLLDLSNEAPIIKLINLMISGAIRDRASDIHVEPFEKHVTVRYRVDGILYEKFDVPKSQHPAVVSRIKIMARLNIAEQRLPQDGRIKILLSGKQIDIRVSVIPVQHGERVVMRILDRGSFLIGLEELGMVEQDYRETDRLIQSTHGIILVTGPTGSGKSTTLYSALQRVRSTETNIITVEDPVEYQLEGIGQIEIKPKIGLSFANALRSILRQDPDVILVGEIRDHETAEMAVHASLTGHLVFSTLHTNDSAGAITRLVNMGIEPFLVTSSTIAILAQRLIRKICVECRTPQDPDPESLRELGTSAAEFGDQVVYHAEGCDACQHRGYFGRTGIFELLPMLPEIQEAVLRGADSHEIKKLGRARGMRTLRDDGTEKVRAGITSIEEVLRVTRDDQIMQDLEL